MGGRGFWRDGGCGSDRKNRNLETEEERREEGESGWVRGGGDDE